MARIGFTDLRGGDDSDSMSSRASSPEPTQRRLPSPNNDDDDPEVPPVIDDDTPPPPNQPLIRQAMGFGNLAPAVEVTTYEAAPLKAKGTAPTFLPGQAVTIPESPPKKKKEARAKRTKYTDNFSDQVGRWRLKAYDPSASAEPPVQNGSGPYSSMYRAESEHREETKKKRAKAKGKTKKVEAPKASKSPSPFTPVVSTAASTPGIATSSGSSSSTTGQYYRRDYEQDHAALGLIPGTIQREIQRASSEATACSSRVSPPPPPPAAPVKSYYRAQGQHRQPIDAQAQRNPKPRSPIRMVTVLIIDVRSGTPDHQLAEVKIPIAPAENPEDGFWADSRDLCEQLQEGPSRIDGPAKVYTLRGKYRQFFLRVTEDNNDEMMNANLSISTERTIEIIVELGARPGQIPAPPRIPRSLQDSRSPSPPMSPVGYARPFANNMVVDPSLEYPNAKKRAHSPESMYLDPHPSQMPRYGSAPNSYHHPHHLEPQSPSLPPTPSSSSRAQPRPPYGPNSYHPVVQSPSSKRMRSGYLPDLKDPPPPPQAPLPPMTGPPPGWRVRTVDPRQRSPQPDDDDEEIFIKTSKRVDLLLQKELDWRSWFLNRGKPQSVPTVLILYRFLQRLFDKHEGKKVPFKTESLNIKIERRHILAALQMKDPDEADKFAADCSETLKLLALYGPDGSRLQDPTILEMVADSSNPKPDRKPIKILLHKLRAVDQEWNKLHGALDAKPESSRMNNATTRRLSESSASDKSSS